MPGAIFDDGRHGKSKCALIAIFYPSCDENTFFDSIEKNMKIKLWLSSTSIDAIFFFFNQKLAYNI